MRIPTATYRVQLTGEFPFRSAREILPYLDRLGVSDLYVSPILEARPGSTHGYDVTDPLTVNPELGGREELEGLLAELSRRGLGLLVDIVPNHMAFDGGNHMLVDVLENGPDSRFFGYFDVDWNHPYESIKGRLLAPFLGDFYGTCLERGELKLVYDREGLSVRYFSLSLPLSMGSYTRVLTHRQAELRRDLGKEHADYLKYLGLLYVLRHLPPGVEVQERYDQIAFAKAMLWELYSNSPQIRRFLDENLEHFNGRPGDPASFDDLDSLLGEQHFRLAFWKVGTEELNYRRFFSINELICLKVEQEEVFNYTHALILELAGSASEVGLRVDHVDGLYDPYLYLKRLRERLPDAYLVEGTTGYDFLAVAGGLFCSRRNRLSLNKIYRRFAGGEVPFPRLVQEKKRLIAEKHMVGDIDNLAHLLKGLAGRYRYASDYTLYGFKKALGELLALFPVYRTYVGPGRLSREDLAVVADTMRRARQSLPDFVHELDFVERIFKLQFEEELPPEEQRRWYHFIQRFQQFTGPLMAKGLEDTALYGYHRLLSLNEVGGNPDKFGTSVIEFHHFNLGRARRWPHSLNTLSTHDTKRGEDVRARISVLSEIPQEWEHHVNLWRRQNRRHKVAEAGREIPDSNDEYFLYQTLLGAWPLRAAELPQFQERLRSYVIKAVREAKVHTAWLSPDAGYEEGFLAFVDRLLAGAGLRLPAPSPGGDGSGGGPEPAGPGNAGETGPGTSGGERPARSEGGENPFLVSFLPFQRRVAWYGMLNSLAQTLLKMSCPGVPDFYQGSELWDLNLVDPDNRRPVDYPARGAVLRRIEEGGRAGSGPLIAQLLAAPEDGGAKMLVIHRVLAARAREQDLFARGAYRPLEVRGERKRNLVVFARSFAGRAAVVAVPRFFTSLAPEGDPPLGRAVWRDTRVRLPEPRGGSARWGSLPRPAHWVDAVSGRMVPAGEELSAAELFGSFPGALLLPGEG